MKSFANRTKYFGDSIFATMSKLAIEHKAVNLGQGFPDFDGPEWLKEIAKEKIEQGFNQYAPFPGTQNLRLSISKYYKKFYDLDYDANTEVSVFAGATEGIFASIMALVSPGDEVIIFEPFYDSYQSAIRMAGGVPVAITLKALNFEWDMEEIENSITTKTKLIILNNPHNPTGKVFKKEELTQLSEVCCKNDLYCMSDEVYEFLVYDEAIHLPLATIENMKERTLTISSAGKTFGLTGWKIGWVCSSEKVSKIIRQVHQYITFSVATPLQEAVAIGLDRLDEYIPEFRNTYKEKRDLFYSALTELNFDFKKPQGTYFMMVPIDEKTDLNDVDFSMELIKTRKIVGVPPSAFYMNSDEGTKYLRFCYAKKNETLNAAIKNLHGF